MITAHRRHDISDPVWEYSKDYLPGRPGTVGCRARNNREFLNAVFWILRPGAPGRDLPPDYGDWKNIPRRFCRGRDKGLGESLLEKISDEADFEWLMMDATPSKVHPHGTGSREKDPKIGRTKGDQHPDTWGRGCEWSSGPSTDYRRYPSRLYTGSAVNSRPRGRLSHSRSGAMIVMPL